jgi:hypothetical protein
MKYLGSSLRYCFYCLGNVGAAHYHEPNPVVPSNSSLASVAYSSGTKTSLGPAERKSGTSKPLPLWTSTGMLTSSSSPFIKRAKVSFGAAATLTHASSRAHLLLAEV